MTGTNVDAGDNLSMKTHTFPIWTQTCCAIQFIACTTAYSLTLYPQSGMRAESLAFDSPTLLLVKKTLMYVVLIRCSFELVEGWRLVLLSKSANVLYVELSKESLPDKNLQVTSLDSKGEEDHRFISSSHTKYSLYVVY